MKIVSEYEELLRVQEFFLERKNNHMMEMAYDNTRERLKNDLKNQYFENIDEKINRWISVTKVPYFEENLAIPYYIQAKMLYRDGFYEAAISVSRSICEMICFLELSKITHPFGDLTIEDKHSPSFSVLKQFLLLPKRISKKEFLHNIIPNIVDHESKDKDSNFLKSSYELNRLDQYYYLKIGNAKKDENLNRFIKIFKSVNYVNFETFTDNVLKSLEFIWSKGSSYIHVKKSSQDAKEDAFKIITNVGYVLSTKYGKEISDNTHLISAYSSFPDICTGVSYWMEVSLTPEEAHINYLNLPSKRQMNRMMGICGEWFGEWGINEDIKKGKLIFMQEGEVINCYLELVNKQKLQMGISFYGDYFRINALDEYRETYYFEFSFFNKSTLIGKHMKELKYAKFEKIE